MVHLAIYFKLQLHFPFYLLLPLLTSFVRYSLFNIPHPRSTLNTFFYGVDDAFPAVTNGPDVRLPNMFFCSAARELRYNLRSTVFFNICSPFQGVGGRIRHQCVRDQKTIPNVIACRSGPFPEANNGFKSYAVKNSMPCVPICSRRP